MAKAKSKKTKSKKSGGATPPSKVRRPLLIVDKSDLPAVAAQLATLFADSDKLFERGDIVKLFKKAGGFSTIRANANDIINAAHKICRPVIQRENDEGEIINLPITLPRTVANLYQNLHGEWGVRELGGVCPTAILSSDGSIRTARGYDPATKFWCVGIDIPPIPTRPSLRDAKGALRVLRAMFATFPFSDAMTVSRSPHGRSVDTSKPPALDESAYLTALITAVCRSSLPLAPGLALRAPHLSGSGTGKGLLVSAISQIAYNGNPRRFTSSGETAELEKRLTAALVSAAPMISIDNTNDQTVHSNLLASVITENPVEIRQFHQNTEFITVDTHAFILINGNLFRLAEDLVRRFILCEVDARCENPEQRRFRKKFRNELDKHRRELLVAVLTIWRWGRLNRLDRGITLGSFEEWGEWCRDPLLALGCADPVVRMDKVKSEDPRRQQVAQFFSAWHARHGDREMEVSELDPTLWELAGPYGRNRQVMADFVKKLDAVTLGGFALKRIKTAKWSNSIYTVTKTK
jgi:hypothetical protein